MWRTVGAVFVQPLKAPAESDDVLAYAQHNP
jgi:hypothetical protein